MYPLVISGAHPPAQPLKTVWHARLVLGAPAELCVRYCLR